MKTTIYCLVAFTIASPLLAQSNLPRLLAVSLALSPWVAAAETPHSSIGMAVQKEIKDGRFPGAVILVGTRTAVLYHEAFGEAQVVPERVPMRKDSIFDMASVTKPVCTGTALGICRDRGLIDPDGRLLTYLPDHHGQGVEAITLRHLAAHVSGFPDSPRVSYGSTLKGDAIFRRLLMDSPKRPVNTQFEYSCRNLILLSTVVERVTEKAFGEFCQKEIFDVLEMKDARFNQAADLERAVATHHPVRGENHNADGRDAARAIGNAGLFCTARDLSHFCEMMLGWGEWRGKRILSRETIEEFIRPYPQPGLTGHAFTWEVSTDSTHRPKRMQSRAYGHSGSTGISLWIDPDLQVYTLVLTNRTHPVRHAKDSEQGREEYRARSRIADAALSALGFGR